MRALVTGFEGFQGKSNPSGQIALDLDGVTFGELSVTGRELPEDFAKLPHIMKNLIVRARPDILVSTGWDYISKFKIEKIAVNVMNSEFGDRIVPDNRGHSPTGKQVISKAPVGLKSTFPAERILKRFERENLAAYLSYSAGTHCCNTVMFLGIYYTQRTNPRSVAGFIHIPPTPEMKVSNTKSFSLAKEAKAVEQALIVCRDYIKQKERKP